MPRNPELTYIYEGELFGPGHAKSVADLDKAHPLAADRAADPNAGATPSKTQTEPPAAPPAGPPAVVDSLPEDFPNRAELVAAGITSARAVQAQTDAQLIALPNVGPAAVKKIRTAAEAIVKAEGK
jgi:hypothetical protein